MHNLPEHHAQPSYYLESIVDQRASTASLKAGAYTYLDELIGWCSRSKCSILVDIVQRLRPTVIVEIGVWGGKSLIPMAYVLKTQGQGKIYGIDPWDSKASIQGMESAANLNYWQTVDHENAFHTLVRDVERFQLGSQVELVRATSEAAAPIHGIQLLHIDGNHSAGISFLDVKKWVPLMDPGGWIVVDDISWYENGKVTQAESVEWLDHHCHRLAMITETNVWGIWIKK